MSAWDNYISRVESRGDTRRKVLIRDEKRYINTRLPDNPSYQLVEIDGEEQMVAIINSDNLNEKMIIPMPGEDIRHGALVWWMDCYWLIDEKDIGDVLYTRGHLIQCNHLLKWVDENHEIHEQWCYVEDGTKLKCIPMHYGLVCGKLHAKRTPLYAGIPLELYYQNRTANSRKWQWFKKYIDWAISSEVSNRDALNDYPGCGSRGKRPGIRSPKPLYAAW